VTGSEIGVRTGRAAAGVGRCVGTAARVIVPLLVTLLVVVLRLVRHAVVAVARMARARAEVRRAQQARPLGPVARAT
jgi:hypothetical protein